MEFNSKILDSYVLVSNLSNDKKVKIPKPNEDVDINDDLNEYLILDKNNKYWENHYVNVLIDSNVLLRDLRKHLRSYDIVKKNFEVDMPRSKFFINRKRITNPSEAMKIICKNKNYKNILRLSTASLLGIPYELIYTSYNKFNKNKYSDEILHLSDSIPKSMVVSVNLLEDETCEINVIKMLQLLKVSDDNTPLGIITLKLSIKLEKEKTDNNCILFWNYSRLSSV
jgi:hypothetical protein